MRVDPFFTSNLTSALSDSQARQQQLSAQLSSGMKIMTLSGDPVSAGQNVLLLNQIQRDDSFSTTSSLVTGQLQVADSALGEVVKQLTQALSLATSANNGTMSPNDVKSVGSELAGILNEVQALANTNYQGRYIFAGGQTTSPPFDTSAGVTTYDGDGNVNFLELPNGQKIQLNVPGDQIFLGADSTFAALNALVADYATGSVNLGQAAADTAALNKALNFISQKRVIIDNSITQISAASTAVMNEKTQLLAAQTNLMQADLPTIATQLSQIQLQQSALVSVIVQLESASNSLFSKM